MTWFKVDDNLAFHPKILQAGNAAMGLWVRAGSWSAQQLTNGRIPDGILPSLGTRKQAEALAAAGLWTRGDGAWHFHEWNADGRQPTREKVEADRVAAAERQRKHREERASSQRDKGVTNSVSHGDVTGVVTPTPTRPDPTRPDPLLNTPTDVGVEAPQAAPAATKNKRRTRIPDPFIVTPEMVAWAQKRVPGLDGRLSTERFINHFTAVGGTKGLMADWTAAWRNWLLADYDRGQNMAPNAPRPVTGRMTRGQERDAELMDFMTKADGQAPRQEITS